MNVDRLLIPATLEIYVWDVEHGNCLTLKTHDGRVAMIDFGMNTSTDFSPAQFVARVWGVERLDYLIVSHPHLDHIRDIANVKKLTPRVLHRRHIATDRLVTGEYAEYESLIREYVEFEESYRHPLTIDDNPANWSIEFANFDVCKDGENVNDLGVATFVSCGGFTLFHPGDVEKDGWDCLLEKKDFTNMLERTSFLMASHHGRESGFSTDIFRFCTPKLTIVSDGRYGDTSATSRYSTTTEGWAVYDSGLTTYERRKVVTTRNDGRIRIRVDVQDRSTNVHVDRKPITK